MLNEFLRLVLGLCSYCLRETRGEVFSQRSTSLLFRFVNISRGGLVDDEDTLYVRDVLD